MTLNVAVTDMAIYGILFLLGLAICFFGYQLLRAWLFVAGLQAGFFLGLWLGGMLFKSPVVALISAMLLGIVLAGLFGLIIKVGGFLAGAGVMAILALLLLQLFGIPAGVRVYIILVMAIGGGLLGIFSIRPFLVLATAANGAFLAADSIFNLIKGHPAGQYLANHSQLKAVEWILLLVAMLVLLILGSMVQFRLIRRAKARSDQRAATAAAEAAAPSSPDKLEPPDTTDKSDTQDIP